MSGTSNAVTGALFVAAASRHVRVEQAANESGEGSRHALEHKSVPAGRAIRGRYEAGAAKIESSVVDGGLFRAPAKLEAAQSFVGERSAAEIEDSETVLRVPLDTCSGRFCWNGGTQRRRRECRHGGP